MARKQTYEELEQRVKDLEKVAFMKRKAEEALQEIQEKYRKLFHHSNDSIFIHDLDGNILDVNQRTVDLFGYSRSEMLSMNVSHLHPSWVLNRSLQAFETIHRDEFSNLEMDFKNKNGGVFAGVVSSSLFQIGQMKVVQEIVRDITDRKQAEKAVWESEKKYKTLIDNAKSIILRWKPNGDIIYLNPYGLDYFKYKKEDIVGRHVIGTIVPEEETTGRNLREMIDDITKHPEKYKNNLNQNVCSDGELVWVSWTNVAILDATEAFVEILSIGNDVTGLVLAEQALKLREKELEEQAQNLEEINTALKVLIKKRDEDKIEIEEKVLINVKELVVEYLVKLKGSGLNERQSTYVHILESNLNDIVSPFLQRVSNKYRILTPTEMQVADLVRQGKTSKEIAGFANLSPRTIEFHRDNIRKKMGLKNEKINLRSHLLTFQ